MTNIGIIGGSGWLGRAMLSQLIAKHFVEQKHVFIANRSGQRTGLDAWPLVNMTTNNQELAANCDTIILSVRPQHFPSIALQVENQLVISVMAGVKSQRISEITGAQRIVRAMPNVAAEIGMSYTPWFAAGEIEADTLEYIHRLFETLGATDQVEKEDYIDFFTALTGSGQGWVAFFEQCLIQCGIQYGLKPTVSEHAIRQLFLGMGTLLAKSPKSIADSIQELLNYAGTTAAGLNAMIRSKIQEEIAQAIQESYRKATSDMTK